LFSKYWFVYTQHDINGVNIAEVIGPMELTFAEVIGQMELIFTEVIGQMELILQRLLAQWS